MAEDRKKYRKRIYSLREKRLHVTRRMVTTEAIKLYNEIGDEGKVDSLVQT